MTASRGRGTGANLIITTTGAVLVTIVPGLQAAAAQAVADSLFGGSAGVRLILALLSWAFTAVAVAVSTSTAQNAFTVVLTGRLETIALRRLLGSSARRERARLLRVGIGVGTAGCMLGLSIGLGLLLAVAPVGLGSPSTAVSIGVGLVAMFVATIIGVRRAADQVLDSAPIGGLRLSRSDERRRDPAGRGRMPILFVAGLVVLSASVPMSLVTPFAIFIGVLGGITAMLGSLTAMAHVLPLVVRISGRLLPQEGAIALAARLLATRPTAAARAATGLFTGTAVVSTFVVALATLTSALAASYEGDPAGDEAIRTMQAVTASIGTMISLVVVLSAVGLTSSLLHSLRQRRREIATLRILGQRSSDARTAIAAEAALLVIAAVGPGLLLGAFTGWVGAQDVLGAVRELGVLPPVLPLPLLAAAALGSTVLVASVTHLASRQVLSAPPVRAVASA